MPPKRVGVPFGSIYYPKHEVKPRKTEHGRGTEMSSNVIGLFESKSVADKVAQELLDAGFNQRNINRYEGSQDELERELGREGISDADADYYAEGLRSGGALVSVRAKDNQVDEAVDIMNRYANTGTADDATYEGVTADAGTVDYAASSARAIWTPTSTAVSIL